MIRHLLLIPIFCFALGAVYQSRALAAISIKRLISKAKPGQAVRVPPGTYLEDVVIPAGVSLVGTGAHNTVLVGGIKLSATPRIPVSLSRITVIHTGSRLSSGVSGNGGNVSIRHSLLISEGGFATVNLGAGAKASLRNNIIVGPVGNYAVFGRDQADMEIINNTIVVQGFGVGLMDQSYATIRNCLFYGDAKPAIIRTSSDYSISYSNFSLTGGSFYFKHDLINGDVRLRDPENHPKDPTSTDITNKDLPKYESVGLTFIRHEHFKSRNVSEYRRHVPRLAIHAGSPDRGDNNADGSRNNLGAFGGPLGNRWD